MLPALSATDRSREPARLLPPRRRRLVQGELRRADPGAGGSVAGDQGRGERPKRRSASAPRPQKKRVSRDWRKAMIPRIAVAALLGAAVLAATAEAKVIKFEVLKIEPAFE